MRIIGSLPDKSAADRFGDYLITLQLDHSIEQNGARWDVWIADDDQVERGRRELDSYLQSPDEPRYNVGHEASTLRGAQQKKQHKLRRNFIDVRTNWAQVGGRYPLTIALIVICCVVALATLLGERLDPVGRWLMFSDVDVLERALQELPGDAPIDERQFHGIVRSAMWRPILHGQVWRLITPIFIHFGVIHLLFNLFWLRDLGAMIEIRRGTLRFAALVLTTAIISNVAESLWSGPFFGGMSGVVYGLFGYAWMKSRFQPHLQIHVGQNTILIMLGWLIVCAVGIIGNVANAAHVAGLLVGIIAGFPFRQWRQIVLRRQLGRR